MALQIMIKKLRPHAVTPTRGSKWAAGYDLYFCPEDGQDAHIMGFHRMKLGTGIALSIPQGYFGAIYPRSGLAYRQGLRLTNSVGVIDPDYRGEIMVPLFNDSGMERVIEPGDRIAQIIFEPYSEAWFQGVKELDETDRGEGGFGSTGEN